MRNKIVAFSLIDLYSFLFSILVAMWFGNVFSPHLFIFLIFFVSTKSALYFYWFKKVERTTLPWKRFAVHTAILLVVIPILGAISASISLWFSNAVFWLVVVPIFVSVASLLLHRIYKISSNYLTANQPKI